MYKQPKMSPRRAAVVGFVSMAVFYYGLLWATTQDVLHPVFFFAEKWYLLAPLFAGFTYQMFLFQQLRFLIHEHQAAMAGVSAGTSGFAMAACCAHHVADWLPFVGFAGAAAITKYQDVFLAIGVLVNVIGVAYMWRRVNKQRRTGCAEGVSV